MKDKSKLKAASLHLYYELWMFNKLVPLLRLNVPSSYESVEKNAYLESFVIHFRVLLDFFYSTERYKTDILAEHYIDDWKDIRPNPPKLKEWKRRVGTEVAHLSFARTNLTESAKRWDISEIRQTVNLTAKSFIREVKQEDLDSAHKKAEWEKLVS